MLKSKGVKKERLPDLPPGALAGEPEEHHEPLRSAALKASDLKDGLRLLILQEGKFWPARLNSTKLPDVWGLVMDRQRGNRPIILPRDDILKEAVSDQSEAGIRILSANERAVKQIICFIQSWEKGETKLLLFSQPKLFSNLHIFLGFKSPVCCESKTTLYLVH